MIIISPTQIGRMLSVITLPAAVGRALCQKNVPVRRRGKNEIYRIRFKVVSQVKCVIVVKLWSWKAGFGRTGFVRAEPLLKKLQVVLIDFKTNSPPAEVTSTKQGCPYPGKGIEHHFAGSSSKDLDTAPGELQRKSRRVVYP